MTTSRPIKEKSFYYKIFLAVLTIAFLNITYLLLRKMSGGVSFYFFSLSKKNICIILSLLAMPINFILISLATLFIKKINRNLFICSCGLAIVTLFLIHTNTARANFDYKQDKIIDNMNLEYFKWEENNNAPLGYPIDVYQGGFELKDGNSIGLSMGTSSGIHGWGAPGGGRTSDRKALPDGLDIIWLSYAEDTFYHIDCAIDYEKMLKLFQEGYDEKDSSGKIRHETYSRIIVGYAPRGVLVVWVFGSSKQVEVGRYQGKKIVIHQQEIDHLDYPKKLFFQQSYRDDTMNDKDIVPTAVREANKKKPIPYGIWDTYREKYLWRPNFKQNKFKDSSFTMIYARMEMFNGEVETLFDEHLLTPEYTMRAIPKIIKMIWRDKNGQAYGGDVIFDDKTCFDAFKEIYKEGKDTQVEIVLEVNIPNTFITVVLKSKDKEVSLNKNAIVDVIKTSKKFY